MNEKLSTVTNELLKERGFYFAEDGDYYNTSKKVRIHINHIIPRDKYYPLVLTDGSHTDFTDRGFFDSHEEALIKGVMDVN